MVKAAVKTCWKARINIKFCILQEWEQTIFWHCRKQFHAEKERSVLGVLGHSRILAISRRPKTAIFIVLTNGLLLTLQPYMVVVPWKLVVTPYILDPVIRHNVSTFHLWSGSPMPFPEARHKILCRVHTSWPYTGDHLHRPLRAFFPWFLLLVKSEKRYLSPGFSMGLIHVLAIISVMIMVKMIMIPGPRKNP